MKRSPRRSRWQEAWIGLGSNLGDRVAWLAAAIRAMREIGRTRLTGVSPAYRSPPAGFRRQPAFVNAAARVATGLAPGRLLVRLHGIEKALGRRRTFRNGPRNIDLDLLLYGDTVLTGSSLTVPHPRLHERAFALAPCAALDPHIAHPVIGVKLSELLARAPDWAAKLPARQQRRFRRLAGEA